MEKKYQIFISSTYKDLVSEREKVRDVILSMYHFPIGMEMFNAADEEQWEIIKETIDSSDYYVLIIGKRYGSTIPDGKPDTGMSYTEKEYRYAVANGIPVLTFIKKDSAVTADKMDKEPEKIAKLESLVNEITGNREADWFENIDELGTKVTLALLKQMNRKNRPGWVRGDRFDVDASINELITLSQRVRELTDENEKLKALFISRKPALNVSVQFVGTIDEPLEVDEEDVNAEGDEELPITETIQRCQVPESGYFGSVESMSPDDVPDEVKDLVTQEIIDDYNSKLPDKKVIDEYDDRMRIYNEIRKNGQRLDFIISNDGTAKATDINITLEFPKSFIIMKRSEAETMAEPKKPKSPTNPIDEAMMQKQILEKSGAHLQKLLRYMGDSYAGLSFAQPNPLSVDAALIDRNFSTDWSVEINGQIVNFWSHDLLHTYTRIVDSLCIIPLEKGTFTVKVSMMCEEYIQPEESELEIIVE